MKIKTDELTGAALDWAVAKCEDESVVFDGRVVRYVMSQFSEDGWYSPSTDWDQGGPIIERELIGTLHIVHGYRGPMWTAAIGSAPYEHGSTPLIAAMRCRVASKLGIEVEVPTELVNT